MKINIFIALTLCFGLTFAFLETGIAQDDAFTIHVSKDFGYNMGSNIQGRFTIQLLGDTEKVSNATFYIDDIVLESVDNLPFSYQFETEQFDSGMHQFFAEVLLDDDQTITTPAVKYNFLSQKEANQQVRNLLLGIGGAVVGSVALVALVQGLIISKGDKGNHQLGTPRHYGMLGGTICPKCGRPFPRHIWGINLLVGRLDRCDNCSKWVMTTRATPNTLKIAEEAEIESLKQDDKHLKVHKHEGDLLDETKYFDEI